MARRHEAPCGFLRHQSLCSKAGRSPQVCHAFVPLCALPPFEMYLSGSQQARATVNQQLFDMPGRARRHSTRCLNHVPVIKMFIFNSLRPRLRDISTSWFIHVATFTDYHTASFGQERLCRRSCSHYLPTIEPATGLLPAYMQPARSCELAYTPVGILSR